MTLVAALLAAAPAPERLDALAFDNGAVLLVNGGSFGAGVARWSTWALTDGDRTMGWCSPKGSPTGLAFVWDLDTTWSLEALTLSNEHLQDDGYPGIATRRVELWLGPEQGSLRKVGEFSLQPKERKEFKLPRGTTARQVKLVVAANHGHAEYTELAEVELLGTRAAPVPRASLGGDYLTGYGPLRLAQDGDEVYGCYDWTDGAAVDGVVTGRTAKVSWREPGSDGTVREGTAIFSALPGGKGLQGVWYERGAVAGEWSGPPAEPGKGPRCTPRRRGQLERLRKEGHLVLYGLRFDTDSAVPRPESDATLDQLAGMLKEDPALTVQVEGHTDAVASAAHNLDLSRRRAQAVVEALTRRGVGSQRLRPEGLGASRPVADNATAQGRALNRRVEVSVPR
jgi:outer membrane protein OmpA-like peptidoglycan-associated protein